MRKIKSLKKALILSSLNINNLNCIQKTNHFYWKWYLNYFIINNCILNKFNVYLKINSVINLNYITYLLFKNIFCIIYFNTLKQIYYINQLLLFSLK